MLGNIYHVQIALQKKKKVLYSKKIAYNSRFQSSSASLTGNETRTIEINSERGLNV